MACLCIQRATLFDGKSWCSKLRVVFFQFQGFREVQPDEHYLFSCLFVNPIFQQNGWTDSNKMLYKGAYIIEINLSCYYPEKVLNPTGISKHVNTLNMKLLNGIITSLKIKLAKFKF